MQFQYRKQTFRIWNINSFEVVELDFNQLSMFLMLTQYRQFSEAAERENISQSSLSKQIKALEEEAGSKLFMRGAKGAELTAAGREFYTFAQSALESKQAMHSRIAAHIDAQSNSTTIGVMPVLASFGIAALIADFRRKFPQYSVNVIEKNTREIVHLLDGSSLNMALIGTALADLDKYHEYSLVKDPFLLAVASEHPLARRDIVDLKSLENEPFIQLENSIGINNIVFAACNKAGFVPSIAYNCNIVPSAISLVKQGLGVFPFTSKELSAVSAPGIKLIELQDKLYGELVLVTSKSHDPNQADTAFRSFALNWYK